MSESDRADIGIYGKTAQVAYTFRCQTELVRDATEQDYKGLAELSTTGKNGRLGIEDAMLKAGNRYNQSLADKASPEAKAYAKKLMQQEFNGSESRRSSEQPPAGRR